MGAVYTSGHWVDDFGARVVAEARTWIDTPFHPQQSVKGRGCDCKGLVAGVARALGRPEGDSLFARMGAYDIGHIDTRLLGEGLAALFDRVAAGSSRAGDLLLLRVGGAAQHLAIVSEVLGCPGPGRGGVPHRMIHCYGKGPSRVIEVPMGHVWRDAVASIWRWRDAVGEGVDGG